MNDRVAIPGYRVVRPIATGGMGSVHEVEKLATRKRFAAKFLHEHLAVEREYRLRFEREVGALCSVRHPHIVNVFGWRLPGLGEGGKPYILMEMLHGEGLDQLLAREVALPPRRAISTLLQVLDGLVAAHTAGVIHRDLGPSNVFLTDQPDGEPLVKLLDFGLAGPVGRGEAGINVTQAGTVMGKPAYVAPEMFESRPIDARSDIFACGVLLFRMVAGRLPFREQESNLLWIERYAERTAPREYPALHEVLASVPECLDEVCARAMRRDPDHRYRSAREMQIALLDADTELARLAGETSESSLSWSDALQPGRPLADGVPGAASTIAFNLTPTTGTAAPQAPAPAAPDPYPAGPPRPDPGSAPAPARPVRMPDRDVADLVIKPIRPRPAAPETSSAWEVLPSTPSPSSSSRRIERSGSSVVARSVPAGARSFALRPAVVAASIVLLALTVALVVILARPATESAPTPPTTAAPAAADPAGTEATPTPPAPPPPDTTPATRPPTGPVEPPLVVVTPPPSPPDAAPDRVRITLLGVPPGAIASLDGAPLAGEPLAIVVPRSRDPLLLRIAAPGYRIHESRVTPSADLAVSVPLVRLEPPPAATTAVEPSPATTPRTGAGRRPPGGDRGGVRPLPSPSPSGGSGSSGLPLPETPPW